MTAFLLDVNVLIALMWPAEEAHSRVQQWFARHSREGWATCPITQAGFVRIVSNPGFSRDAVPPPEAMKILSATLKHPGHSFWADEIDFVQAAQSFAAKLIGHQQITDAYLLGLAMHKKAKLATLDRSVSSLLPEKSSARDFIEII